MREEDEILDDVNSILLIPDEDIIWEGKPHNEDTWLIAIAVLLGFVVLFKLIRYFIDGSFSFDLDFLYRIISDNLVYIITIIWFVFFPYYIRKNEKYWLLKNRIAIRKGFKRNIIIFNFSDIKNIQHGVFEDAPSSHKDYIVFSLHKKINNPFSLFKNKKDIFSMGPFENSQEVYELLKKEIGK